MRTADMTIVRKCSGSDQSADRCGDDLSRVSPMYCLQSPQRLHRARVRAVEGGTPLSTVDCSLPSCNATHTL